MTTPPFFVRDARPGDRDVIASFNAALAAETEGKTLDAERLRRGVQTALGDRDRLRYWVAVGVVSDTVVGQAAVTREWSDWRNGWLWWLQSVYVAADSRRRGVFRLLYATVRECARAEQVAGLRLYVEHANTDAHRTYEALGFVPAGYDVYEQALDKP